MLRSVVSLSMGLPPSRGGFSSSMSSESIQGIVPTESNKEFLQRMMKLERKLKEEESASGKESKFEAIRRDCVSKTRQYLTKPLKFIKQAAVIGGIAGVLFSDIGGNIFNENESSQYIEAIRLGLASLSTGIALWKGIKSLRQSIKTSEVVDSEMQRIIAYRATYLVDEETAVNAVMSEIHPSIGLSYSSRHDGKYWTEQQETNIHFSRSELQKMGVKFIDIPKYVDRKNRIKKVPLKAIPSF